MATRINEEQRQAVLKMLAQGHDRETIAAHVGVTPGQVSAVAAHVKMGTYDLEEAEPHPDEVAPIFSSKTENLLAGLRGFQPAPTTVQRSLPVLLGDDAETGEEVFWNPSPESGSPNPHIFL